MGGCSSGGGREKMAAEEKYFLTLLNATTETFSLRAFVNWKLFHRFPWERVGYENITY